VQAGEIDQVPQHADVRSAFATPRTMSGLIRSSRPMRMPGAAEERRDVQGSCSPSTDGLASTRALPRMPWPNAPSSARRPSKRAEHLACARQQRLAGRRQLDPAAAAQQQRHADLGLQRGDAFAQRRGDQRLALGGARDAAFLAHGDEVLQ
jgi:hypothetical protein